ncbi:shikimate dehydrogenase family protein [Nocardioides deserti]|uniref:Shikimate dehydrogenase n=1 Tax=Nocardioides deserti TaxID=1588644 RepID=A0ABR6UCV9_9ACTN|nr:shikimate dehydrogenase [Nocardioides deserti]MBC2961973.1 shikimate dehydrogenase [Nocardioides deserti]GGO70671.1 shikimate 5-dehydrogenase [Nocardioides deserti]
MRITGETDVVFILCDPVAHVRGSDILNRRFAAAGDDVAVSPLHVVPEDLPVVVSAVRSMRNVAGFGVTIPHKVAVVGLLDELTDRARLVGAINFVRRSADGTLTGDNVDGAGFIAGLAADGLSVDGASVLQVGAGGAGRAVAFAVAGAGARRLRIHNRSPRAAEELAAAVAAAHPACDVRPATSADPRETDVAVNTTSLGMRPGDPLPFDVAALPAHAGVAEIVIQPRMTALLEAAVARGLPVSYGRSMLEGQFDAVRSFLWPDGGSPARRD